MLLLFETAGGFALFKVNKEDKLEQANVRLVDIWFTWGRLRGL